MTSQQKLDIPTIKHILKMIDKSPAVTWTGKGGVRERILELIHEDEN